MLEVREGTVSDSQYALGVHNFDQGSYQAGDLAAYYAALGVDALELQGAVAHLKFRDNTPVGSEAWRTGAIPTMSAHNQMFLSEAKALGMRTLVAYVPENSWNETANPTLMANLQTAAALAASTYTDVDIWLFGNERQQKTVDVAEDWFVVENICGQVWQGAGKQWAAGADQAPNNLLSTIQERRADYWATDPDWLVFHEYEALPQHVREIRRATEALTGRSWNIVFTEWALDFENPAQTGTKDWVRDYRAREYAEHWGRALRRERVWGCYFTLRELLDELPDQLPLHGLADSLGDAISDSPPARDSSDVALKSRRYYLYAENALAEWNARHKARRIQQRNALDRIGYWTEE